ncbi:hypothetical protein GQ54DRAFT_303647 [Martensiomyces pterosporus]|nr:hypothetical protein GQ54DRAFT_303647 [Martensiomyces pterosporus]
MTAAPGTALPGNAGEPGAARIYELEARLRQGSETNLRVQKEKERLERKFQFVVEELEALQKSHNRLEAQFFEAEADLAKANSKLDRAQRANAALESNLESKAAALERERESWQKKEGELSSELAAAKRKATLQRRQTVSIGSPSRPSSTASGPGHGHRLSMFAHDLPGSSSAFLSPLANARTVVRENAEYASSAGTSASEEFSQQPSDQQQLRQLTRKLRDAEVRALRATEEAVHVRRELEQSNSDLSIYQRKAERLEHAVEQLNELNETLREDNESYQVLLQMGTMKGGFSFNNTRSSLESRASSGKWAGTSSDSPEDTGYGQGAASLESEDEASASAGAPAEAAAAGGMQGLDLASELSQVLSIDGGEKSRISELEDQNTRLKEELRKTKYERRHLGDENKALSLYVNKILGRILASTDGLEAVLSSDYDSSAAKQRAHTSFATPSRHASQSSGSARGMLSPPPRGLQLPGSRSSAQPETAFPERGSGDGITSVFIPPTSPVATAPQQRQQPPQAFSGRARSATHSAGMAPAPRLSSPPASTSGAGGGSAWWKRMSIRIGSGWSAQEEDSGMSAQPPASPQLPQ